MLFELKRQAQQDAKRFLDDENAVSGLRLLYDDLKETLPALYEIRNMMRSLTSDICEVCPLFVVDYFSLLAPFSELFCIVRLVVHC